MRQEQSDYLHLLRWVAAMTVLIGHASLLGGFPTDNPIIAFVTLQAHAAVIVFFVLSGYVIAATSAKKLATGYQFREYLLDRFSRIYSVLIPALVLTIALDLVGTSLFPARYAVLPQSDWLLRLLVNLFSLQGMWGFRVQFGSDPPLWSIGYEVCYYVLFGLLVWKPRRWQIAAALIALVMGPKVLTYGLIWLMGVYVFRSSLRTPLIPALLVFLAADYFLQFRPVELPEVIRDLLFGLAVAVLVASRISLPSWFVPFNRQMADFSYSLYAFHFPIMFLAFGLFPSKTIWNALAISVATVFICRVLYEFTEKRRASLRRLADLVLDRTWMPRPGAQRESGP